MTADDETSCRLKTIRDLFKDRRFDLFAVIGQEVVSQENEMKGFFWKAGKQVLRSPVNPFLKEGPHREASLSVLLKKVT